MGLYENLNGVGKVVVEIQAYILIALGALFVGSLVYSKVTKRGDNQRPRPLTVLSSASLLVVCGVCLLAISGGNTSFARLWRAFTAGSFMAALFTPL